MTTRRSASLLMVMATLLSAACATTTGSAGGSSEAIAETAAKVPPHELRPGRDRPVVPVVAAAFVAAQIEYPWP